MCGYWPHRIPSLQHGDIWFIPAILGALALIIVAVDVATHDVQRASVVAWCQELLARAFVVGTASIQRIEKGVGPVGEMDRP
jgi:hypothetical protein